MTRPITPHAPGLPWRARFTRAGTISVLIGIAASCSGGSGAGTIDEPCGNDLGNGNEIIAGPSAPTDPFGDQVFRSLTIDPTDANTVYLGTEENGIVKSTDGGTTWQRLRQGLRHSGVSYPEIYDLCVSPLDTGIVLAATADSPGPITGSHPSAVAGIYRSVDGGLSFARANCGLSNSSIAAVRFDPVDPGQLTAFVSAGTATFSGLAGQFFAGGPFWSADLGSTWTAASAPAGAEINRYPIVVASTAAMFTFGLAWDPAATNLGFLRSTDGGRSWQAFAPSQRARHITEFDVSSDGMTIVANELDAFEMLRSRDGGSTWDTLSIGGNGPIAISPADADVVLYDDNGALRRSTDGLGSVVVVLASTRRFDDLEFAPSDPDVIYAATEGYDLWRSADAGATWTLTANLRSDGVLD